MHILFIHGRPNPHPMHAAFANEIRAEFYVVDPVLSWQQGGSGSIKRYLSYILSSFKIPVKKNSIILSDGLYFTSAMVKLVNFWRSPRLIYLLDDEGLYFLYSKYYPKLTRIFAMRALKYANGYICIGNFQTEICRKLVSVSDVKIQTSFNGIDSIRMENLLSICPDLNTHNLVFIGNGPSGWRLWYKGLDIMVSAFKKVREIFPDTTFTIIGNWDFTVRDNVLNSLSKNDKENIFFTGESADFKSLLEKCSLYIHSARGDAWGISVTEAMVAGLPAIVSKITGTAEVVGKVSERFVVEPHQDDLTQAILSYFELSSEEKKQFSELSRSVAKEFTMNKAIKDFSRKFNDLILSM